MSAESPPRKAAGRGLRIALILSLAVNLLVAGVIGGLVIGFGQGGPDGAPALRSMGLGPISFALPRDEREALRQRIEARRDELGQDSGELARAVAAFTAALRAERFDRAAAEEALELQRRHGLALQARGHTILLDHLEAMSARDRAALARRVERGLRRALERRPGPRDR